MKNYRIQEFPDSRIASIDVCEMGKKKHHIAALLELDVTESRRKIRAYNRAHRGKISFTAWLINVIGKTIKRHEVVSSYLIGKKKLMVFEDINISIIVEKKTEWEKSTFPSYY